ncbi:MAG: vitamin B12 dependent-methionine synthase activation domain-containing protein [bacterium]
MRSYTATDCEPELAAILECQQIPRDTKLDRRISELIERAISEFAKIARPRALVTEISQPEFAAVYRGAGNNEPVTPVGDIYPHAEHLALFLLTVGAGVSEQIDWLFSQNDFALGAMLDSVASAAADRVADLVESQYLSEVAAADDLHSLRFSPGYCGWHVSGQQRLFEFLKPEEIGVTLRPSFLMEPLKSISGVIIVGESRIFDFDDSYDFCAACRDHSCRERRPTGPQQKEMR